MMYVKKSTQSVAQPPRFFSYKRNDKQFFDSNCQRATSFSSCFTFDQANRAVFSLAREFKIIFSLSAQECKFYKQI